MRISALFYIDVDAEIAELAAPPAKGNVQVESQVRRGGARKENRGSPSPRRGSLRSRKKREDSWKRRRCPLPSPRPRPASRPYPLVPGDYSCSRSFCRNSRGFHSSRQSPACRRRHSARRRWRSPSQIPRPALPTPYRGRRSPLPWWRKKTRSPATTGEESSFVLAAKAHKSSPPEVLKERTILSRPATITLSSVTAAEA